MGGAVGGRSAPSDRASAYNPIPPSGRAVCTRVHVRISKVNSLPRCAGADPDVCVCARACFVDANVCLHGKSNSQVDQRRRRVIVVTNDALESRLGSRLTGSLIQRTSVFCRIDGEFALPRTNSPRIRVAIRYETASYAATSSTTLSALVCAIFHRLHPPSVVWTITRGERARTNAIIRDKLILAIRET